MLTDPACISILLRNAELMAWIAFGSHIEPSRIVGQHGVPAMPKASMESGSLAWEYGILGICTCFSFDSWISLTVYLHARVCVLFKIVCGDCAGSCGELGEACGQPMGGQRAHFWPGHEVHPWGLNLSGCCDQELASMGNFGCVHCCCW